ncbi:HNH endonuclease signature motif containing protein, partial [Micromonospora zamorensis]|uniref:HNH endonuclease signature motif containing protein n=1 Tax=Micromonospora zamorensis TaxID=709883 RepID=UPI0033DFB56C
GDPAQVVITTSYNGLTRQLGDGVLDTGLHLTPETVRRLACDAAILPAVLAGTGQVLDVGRQRRLITGPLRRALVLRDRGCAFPGCDRPPRWCDAHHIHHWTDGGPTNLNNAVLLCGHHHRHLHHTDWTVRLGDDSHPEFVPPAWLDPDQLPRRNHYHRRT